ncbi:MAG TPA: hypothetical protein PKW33_20800 [Anaerolineaceae bacterium]|mgnify:CR=1 FL=1|nr:hypothetical protein [Anaerolineaceae bacterium]HPN54048.1 hypothetical protein [Anaerolineaceae bacterium]
MIRKLLIFLSCLALLLGCVINQSVQAAPIEIPAPLPAVEMDGSGIAYWGTDFNLGVDWKGNIGQGNVLAIVNDGDNTYIGGDFDIAGDIAANRIAMWDGYAWHSLGEGVNSRVYALAATTDYIYAGGYFTQAGGISAPNLARWNKAAQTWEAMGTFTMTVVSPNVQAIAIADNGDVYVGGSFDAVNGISAKNVAYYNNTTGWHGLGSGITCTPTPCISEVYALATSGSDVYVGGTFNRAGGLSVKNLARWNGSWQGVAGGVGGINSEVNALAVSGSNLYVGGYFTEAYNSGTTAVSNIAMWNGATWNTLSGGVNSDVYALMARNDGVYVGGRFSTAGGTNMRNVARWSGISWNKLKSSTDINDGVDSNVYALGNDNNYRVLVGGFFKQAGDYRANHIAAFVADQEWTGLGSSVNGTVYSVFSHGDDIYVGGAFKSANGMLQFKLSRWNPDERRWTAAANGADFTGCVELLCKPKITAIYVDENYLYVGGNFTKVDLMTARGIARFSFDTWSWDSMNGGMTCTGDFCSFTVLAITAADGKIYAGGSFDKAGGVTVNGVAAWDGVGWSALSSGLSGGSVYALVPREGGGIYAGGSFTSPYSYIARWNGSSWSAVGSGLNGAVLAMAGGSQGLPLYIGGQFTSPAHIARLSGGSWYSLGDGLDGSVMALTFDSSKRLYAGGAFSASGIMGLNNVAAWNGTNWSALNNGTDSAVNALQFHKNFLYMGGAFSLANNYPSQYLARWGSYPAYMPFVSKGN